MYTTTTSTVFLGSVVFYPFITLRGIFLSLRRITMKYTDPDKARELLKLADVFFDVDEDDPPEEQQHKQTINQSDVWGWGCAFGEEVPDDNLCEVAELFWSYGWAGIVYWVSKRNKGMRSEFPDVNRAIDFVRHEENIKKEIPDSTKRAYTQIKYELGA